MADTKLSALGTGVTIMSTELQSVTTGLLTALGTAYDNATNKMPFACAKLIAPTWGTAWSAGGTWEMWGCWAPDGSNYDAALIESAELLCTWGKDASTTARLSTKPCTLNVPALLKTFCVNKTGQTSPASGISIVLYPSYIVTV